MRFGGRRTPAGFLLHYLPGEGLFCEAERVYTSSVSPRESPSPQVKGFGNGAKLFELCKNRSSFRDRFRFVKLPTGIAAVGSAHQKRGADDAEVVFEFGEAEFYGVAFEVELVEAGADAGEE